MASHPSLLQAFKTFQDTVVGLANQYIQDEAKRTAAGAMFAPFSNPDVGPITESALRAYFEQPPAHVAAVNSLDHAQFVNPLVVPNVASVPLRDILGEFSALGPVPYGTVWLALLDVAEIANPVGIRTKESRDYVRQQMNSPNHALSIPSAPQLDSIMSSILSAFPMVLVCYRVSCGPGTMRYHAEIDRVFRRVSVIS